MLYFFLNFNDLIVKLLKKCLIFSLLGLGFFELQELDAQILVETLCFLHEDLLILHINDNSFMQPVEFLFGLLSTKTLQKLVIIRKRKNKVLYFKIYLLLGLNLAIFLELVNNAISLMVFNISYCTSQCTVFVV